MGSGSSVDSPEVEVVVARELGRAQPAASGRQQHNLEIQLYPTLDALTRVAPRTCGHLTTTGDEPLAEVDATAVCGVGICSCGI